MLRREEVDVAVREATEAAWPERREIGWMEGEEARDHRTMAPSDPPVKRDEAEGSTATAVIWCEGGVDDHNAATEEHFMSLLVTQSEKNGCRDRKRRWCHRTRR